MPEAGVVAEVPAGAVDIPVVEAAEVFPVVEAVVVIRAQEAPLTPRRVDIHAHRLDLHPGLPRGLPSTHHHVPHPAGSRAPRKDFRHAPPHSPLRDLTARAQAEFHPLHRVDHPQGHCHPQEPDLRNCHPVCPGRLPGRHLGNFLPTAQPAAMSGTTSASAEVWPPVRPVEPWPVEHSAIGLPNCQPIAADSVEIARARAAARQNALRSEATGASAP